MIKNKNLLFFNKFLLTFIFLHDIVGSDSRYLFDCLGLNSAAGILFCPQKETRV